MPAKLKTAVVGATGYSGLELTRILLRHPQVETPLLLSRQSEATSPINLADLFPGAFWKRALSVATAFLDQVEGAGRAVVVLGDAT